MVFLFTRCLMKKNLYLAAALSLFALMSWGCYTVLKHPQVEVARETSAHEASAREEEEFGFEARPNRVTFGDDCQSCHSREVAAYHAMAVPAPVAEPTPRWAYYYDTPWWFPYYANASGRGGNDDAEDQKKRPFDRRQNSAPAESSSSSGSAAAPAPSGGSVAKPAGESASSSAAAKSDDADKRSERRSNESTSEKKESSRRERKPKP